MSVSLTTEYQNVPRAVRTWPPELRLSFAEEVLQTLHEAGGRSTNLAFQCNKFSASASGEGVETTPLTIGPLSPFVSATGASTSLVTADAFTQAPSARPATKRGRPRKESGEAPTTAQKTTARKRKGK